MVHTCPSKRFPDACDFADCNHFAERRYRNQHDADADADAETVRKTGAVSAIRESFRQPSNHSGCAADVF